MGELRRVYSVVDARDRILEGALAVFSERGLHGTTMREIAQRADVSQALIHHHFKAKEALWQTVGERITADFLHYFDQASRAAGEDGESVPSLLRAYLAYWKEHPAAFRFNLWRILEGPDAERKGRSKVTTARNVPVYQKAQTDGLIRSDMPPGLAMIITGSLVQFWLHSRTEIEDALAVTGDPLPSDDEFLACVLDLISAPRKKART